MKLRWKIFFLCIGVYFITFAAAGLIVTQSTYNNMMEKEIKRCLAEEKNISLALSMLLKSSSTSPAAVDISQYSSYAVDVLGTRETYIEIYDNNLNLQSTNLPFKDNIKRDELKTVQDKGRNYILRRVEGKHYIFITDTISYNNNSKFILSVIKDISYVDDQRMTLWKYFFEAAAAGLIIVAFFTGIMGKIILKPVYNLIRVSKEIAAGKIQERVKVSSRDEIGVLSSQFNTMAQEVERRIGELEDETKRKQRFIDNLTHEIRPPLTSIIGYADLVMNVKYDQDLFYKSLGYIKSEGMRMLKMANSLMDIILLRENKLEFSKYYTSKIKEDICCIMAFKAEEKGIQLKTQGEDYEIYTDVNLLEEVITNLVDNSINACPDNGCVIIGTDFTEDEGYLYVKDNGRGMTGDEIEKIFEPFYRIDKARSRKDGGAGLGMSICIEIIKKLNGKILIESDLSEGTKIKILL